MENEAGGRTLGQVFGRFAPRSAVQMELLSSPASGIKADRERRIVEVTVTFQKVYAKSELYRLEADIAEAYELQMVRILPKYPAECFDISYMSEIICEAKRIGAVINGFFDTFDASFGENDDEIIIKIPFIQAGIDLLDLAKAGEMITEILNCEFGMSYTVTVARSDDADEKFRSYMEQQQRNLEDERQRLASLEASRIAEERAKAASESEKADNKAAEPEVKLARVKSLFDCGEAAEMLSDTLVKCGRMTFDIASPVLVDGEMFEIGEVRLLRSLTGRTGTVTVLGNVFEVTSKETRRGDKISINIGITDRDSSVFIKELLPVVDGAKLLESVKSGMDVAVRGSARIDKFDGEVYFSATDILKIKSLSRMDNAQEKRVELHLHTNMSMMDALILPEQAVNTAARWGHKAVAITDHGTLQGFPTAMLAAEKADIKVLYGMEAYFVDDTARALYGKGNFGFDDEFVVFDLETTGLSSLNNKITEIGAVKICDGEVTDKFCSFVNPGVPIPANIVELTGITDEMVAGAPNISVILPKFFEFCGDRLMIAHNAGFDISFLRHAAEECSIPFDNSYLDTVAMSHYVNPDLSKHSLDSLQRYFGLENFNHHRASDDAEMLALILYKMIDKVREEGVKDFDDLMNVMSENSDPLKLKTYHQVILVKNQAGLKNLYRLVSDSNLKYYRRHPRIPKTNLNAYRDGLILGSACSEGELFHAILDNKTESELVDIAKYYDYLEIQPLCNNQYLIDKGAVADVEGLKNLNRKVIEIGRKAGRPVVATCDAHYLDPGDEIFRRILQVGQKYSDADRETKFYYRTTDEMLAEFDYLGDEMAHKVVIENPNMIADMIEKVRPIPEGFYPPHIDGAEEELTEKCHNLAREMYGDPLPKLVSDRLERELGAIIKNGFAIMYIIARKLVENSEAAGYQVGSRGSVGSSFVATMAGITRVNPLPPHYRCTKCRYSEFIEDGSVGSGYDLPPKNCPNCGIPMYRDGHDIPFETFLGFKGDKTPDIDLNFSGDVQGDAHRFTEVLFGKGHAFRAGTIGTLADKTAYGYVAKYLEGKGISLNKAEVERLVVGCTGIKRTTGQHPGGIIVVPHGYDICDFSPVQHPADDPNSDTVTTHFEFKYLHDTLLKLDILGHDIPTKYKRLEEYTGTNVLDVPMSDPKVYQLFTSIEPLGIPEGTLTGIQTGTLGLPEVGSKFVRGVLVESQPKCFADLLQVSGLTHGTGVWLGNADELIKNNICDISGVIGTRDDIMLFLIHKHNLDKSTAFKIMEDVRKGRGLMPEYEETMKEHGVPDWYIDSCKKIKYMFPKAHAAAYVTDALRLGWYKIYYPLEFYAAYFTAAPDGFDSEIVIQGRDHVNKTLADLQKQSREAPLSQKEAGTMDALQLVAEYYARGLEFLPVSFVKSDSKKFLPESGKIRLPFSSLPGLGENAAEKIKAARENCVIDSIEDLKQNAKLSKSVIEILDRNGALKGMAESNQISMFDM